MCFFNCPPPPLPFSALVGSLVFFLVLKRGGGLVKKRHCMEIVILRFSRDSTYLSDMTLMGGFGGSVGFGWVMGHRSLGQ